MSCRKPSKIARKFWLRLVIYVVYSLLGAFVFLSVENAPYKEFQKNFEETKNYAEKQLKELRNYTNLDVQNMTNERLVEFARKVLEIHNSVSIKPTEWDLYLGFRLTFEIMTTIGYGSTPPKTQAGRLICVFYTLIGIPIFLFLLKSIGEIINRRMTKIVVLAEKKIFKREEPKNIELKVLIGFVVALCLDVVMETVWLAYIDKRGFSFIDAFYCVVVTATTVGFGDLMLTNELTIIICLCLLSTVLDGVTCYMAQKMEEQSRKRGCRCLGENNSTNEDMEAYGRDNRAATEPDQIKAESQLQDF